MSNSLAFLMPGQGSQSVGLLSDLAKVFPGVQDTFAEAGDVLSQDFWSLCQTGTADQINQTTVTQPLMLMADVAVWRVWQQQSGRQPDFLAGHSLGEYAALVAAGALSFADALRCVQVRAQAMQDAVPVGVGAMAAVIGLPDDEVEALCASVAENEALMPANYNAPGQVVVAGQSAAIDRLLAAAKPAGARMAKRLPMSVPSHCALMASAQAPLQAALQAVSWHAPRIPVLRNIDAKPYDGGDIVEGLVAQITQPVQWVQTLNYLSHHGVDMVCECGPGQVLLGLCKRTLTDVARGRLDEPDMLQQLLADWR